MKARIIVACVCALFMACSAWAVDTPVYGTQNAFQNNVTIGSTTAGKNLTVYGTRTSIHTFTDANWNEDGSTWTMGATGPLVHVTGNTTTVTATLTEAIVAGTTYRVTITGTGGGGTATYTLGGVTGTTIAASGAIAIEDFITASTTGGLIITPASASTVSITSITVEKLTDNTGDVTVDGNLRVRSQILAGTAPTAFPSYSFLQSPTSGMRYTDTNGIMFIVGGAYQFSIMSSNSIYGLANGLRIYDLGTSTSQPHYTGPNDTNTGYGFGAADTLSLITNGVERIKVENVDITMSPGTGGGVLSIFKEVNVATDTTLTTAAQVSGAQYNNYGQAANVTLGLPAISAGKSFRVVLGTTAAYYWRVDPNGTDVTYLDGVSTGAGKYIGVSSAAAGNELVCKSAQTGASSYAWFCSTISGSWAQES